MSVIQNCTSCERRLNNEGTVCRRCMREFTSAISALEEMWPRLEGLEAQPAGQRLGSVAGKSSDVSVPGGIAAVLRGNGTLNSVNPSRSGNRDHAADHSPADPPSVSGVLWAIVDEALAGVGGNVSSDVPAMLDWLHRHCQALASSASFGEWRVLLMSLRGWVEHALGDGNADQRSFVPCVDACHDDELPRLVRRMTDRGLDDDWSCPRCQRRYSPEDYHLALHGWYVAQMTA